MPTRRTGAALETAILDAAWEQLAAEGYGHFTFDTVAGRAGTSKPVLYRRWSGREELLRAAIRHFGATRRLPVPDTGSVRTDLLAYLQSANEQRVDVITLFSGLLLSHYDRPDGVSAEEIRADLLGQGPTGQQIIVDRAVARGEIDGDLLTPRIATLPFDLFRLEAMTTLRPVPDHVRRQIVDDIFLPLVERRGTGPGTGHARSLG